MPKAIVYLLKGDYNCSLFGMIPWSPHCVYPSWAPKGMPILKILNPKVVPDVQCSIVKSWQFIWRGLFAGLDIEPSASPDGFVPCVGYSPTSSTHHLVGGPGLR